MKSLIDKALLKRAVDKLKTKIFDLEMDTTERIDEVNKVNQSLILQLSRDSFNMTVPTDKNANNWTGNGFTWLGECKNYTNLPLTTGYGYILRFGTPTNGSRIQVFITYSSTGAYKVYMREYINARWYPWQLR